ncbi:MAG: methylated-DNA--[protein]-cysteine S-methyltransferase [Bacillota bacterium]
MKLATVEVSCGWLAFAWSRQGLYAVTLPHAGPDAAKAALPADITPLAAEGSWPALEDALRCYFAGEPVAFSAFPLDWSGYSPFARTVLEATGRIPYGTTLSYGDVASLAGYPRAARAVGNVLGKNRTPVVIPCHRVVRAGGEPGGFTGGREWKEYLLRLEGYISPAAAGNFPGK